MYIGIDLDEGRTSARGQIALLSGKKLHIRNTPFKPGVIRSSRPCIDFEGWY
jgi:hypothetical protein